MTINDIMEHSTKINESVPLQYKILSTVLHCVNQYRTKGYNIQSRAKMNLNQVILPAVVAQNSMISL